MRTHVAQRHRAWATWANAVTVARLLLTAPLCWYLLEGSPGRAPVLVLATTVLWAGSDWLDGFLARRLGQESRVGEVLDPVADRLGILAVILSLCATGAVPWLVGALIGATDVAVALLAGPSAARGRLSVSTLGKVRTATLLGGLCVLLLGVLLDHPAADVGRVILALATALHVATGVDYVRRARAERR